MLWAVVVAYLFDLAAEAEVEPQHFEGVLEDLAQRLVVVRVDRLMAARQEPKG
jgi:hypothetical protein